MVLNGCKNLICFILFHGVTAVIGADDSKQFSDPTITKEAYPYSLAIVSLGFVCGLFTYYVLAQLHIVPLLHGLILISGFLCGLVTHSYESYRVYTVHILDFNPRYYVTIFYVIYLFRIGLLLDWHILANSWVQMILLAVVGSTFCSVISGLFIFSITKLPMEYCLAILYGLILCHTTASEITRSLQDLPNVKHLQLLFDGEIALTEPTNFILFNIIMGARDSFVSETSQGVLVFLRLTVGGLMVGLFMGYLLKLLMSIYTEDRFLVMSLTLTWSLLSYHIASELYFSGELSLVTVGIFASTSRSALSSEVEEMLLNFWKMMNICVEYIFSFIMGLYFTERLLELLSTNDVLILLVSYFTIYITRMVSIFLLAPILSRTGYGLTFEHANVLILCVTRGGAGFFQAMILMKHTNQLVRKAGQAVFINVVGLQVLSVALHCLITPKVLELSKVTTISMARMNNMNTCLRFLQYKRDHFVSVLKMDRFLSDVKWSLVVEVTTLRHPYRVNLRDDEDDENDIRIRRDTICPDCLATIPHQPTPKEFADMTREARIRILKAKKVSYARQYENGMLNQSAFHILTNAVETAMDAKEAVIELDELFKMFTIGEYKGLKRYKKVFKFLFEADMKEVKMPRRRCRRLCYRIMHDPYFEVFMNCVILLNVIPILYELAVYPKPYTVEGTLILILNTMFCLIYVAEFWIKVLGMATLDIFQDGVKSYFRSLWNDFDFVLLVFTVVDTTLDLCDYAPYVQQTGKLTAIVRAARLIRLIRLLRLVRLCGEGYNKIVNYYEQRTNDRLILAYEVGKGYVIAERGIELMMADTIDNRAIRQDCSHRAETDILAVMRQLGLLQKERPWIAVTVKAKQASMFAVNCLRDATNEVKTSGWIDEIEYNILNEMLLKKARYVNSLRSVTINSPKEIFCEVAWLTDDSKLSDYLFSKVYVKVFEAGEKLCVEGELSDGVFIIVTGLVKLFYTPNPAVLEALDTYGSLPIVDYTNTHTFDEAYEEYLVTGYTFGELCVLTNRPYNCTIYAETSAQAYVLSHEVLRSAFEMFPDPVMGLEARMWKIISVRICTLLLRYTTVYQSYTLEKIRYTLSEALVPNLRNYKIVTVSELVEDIVLIEGVVQDYINNDFYTAPCYIPRTVQKIVLPISSQYKFNTAVEVKLLFVPSKDVAHYEVMEQTEELSQVVSTVSLKCLQHSAERNFNMGKRRRKKKRVSISLGTAGSTWRSTQSVSSSTTTRSRPSVELIYELRSEGDVSEDPSRQ